MPEESKPGIQGFIEKLLTDPNYINLLRDDPAEALRQIAADSPDNIERLTILLKADNERARRALYRAARPYGDSDFS